MTMIEFKAKLAAYLIEKLGSQYEVKEVDEEILTDLFYEYFQDSHDINSQIYINVSTENFTIVPDEFEDNGGILLGFKKVNGLPFVGMLVCGDWEIPVFVTVFFDRNDDLKVYIPEKGNLFNKFSLEAYGTDGEDIHELGMKFNWGDIQKDISEKVIRDEFGGVDLNYTPLKKKEKAYGDMSMAQLRVLLDEALSPAVEDYRKAAEIKRVIDDREFEDGDF